MTYSGLRYQVIIGNIKSEVPPGRRQAYYKVKDVEQVAKDLQAYSIQRTITPTQFLKVTTREEILETTKLSDYIFGGHIDVNRQLAWLEKNPDIAYIVKSEDKVVGYVILLPLQPEKIEKLLREEEHTVNLEPEEIETFEPGKPLHLYGGAIGVLSGVPIMEKRTYGTRLISGLINTLIDMGKEGIVIETITARSTKPDGIRLLRKLGFTQIPSSTEKKNFVLDVKKSGAREVMQYKQALIKSGMLNVVTASEYVMQ